ncbi:MAG: hypothetical protein LBG27_10160 [Spirochaetaceae bacterium]|jgi:hypothetical protein|nr:hypothetical protein [Spirochaetaceae bacterium]
MRINVFLWCTVGLLAVSGAGYAQDVLRGMVTVDSEPVWAALPGNESSGQTGTYPLSWRDAQLAALSGAMDFFSGMIYGWEFEYEVGEKARNVEEAFDWMPLGELSFGDMRMRPDDSDREGSILRLWADYEMDAAQTARRGAWLSGQLRVINARGRAGLNEDGRNSLRDAAKQAVRSLVRGRERERPKTVRGRIALAEFPAVTLMDGEWSASAKFFVEIREIQKYKGY